MSVYPIADYITIFPTLGNLSNLTNGESIFDIPQTAYMSAAKGQYCLVSIADGSLDVDNQELPIMLVLDGVLNNGGNNPVIATFAITAQHNDARYHHTLINNTTKYLIPARPSQLRIRGLLESGAVYPVVAGCFTFKFEYLSKEAVRMMSEESDYTTF